MSEKMHQGQLNSSTTAVLLEKTGIDTLKASLRGQLLQPSDEGYDAARTIYNAMIDRHPRLIVRCTGAADVITAVKFAREHNLVAAVRSGGHNVGGFGVCDDGIVIDLSLMKGMRIDPTAQTVRVEPGVTWGELNNDLQLFGLAGTGGTVSSTGIAGLTLGGGFGWLLRKYGLACDNLLSVDVVTADGRLLKASSTENTDLFWGIRGGGGNFGIVTSFKLRVYPVGTVLGGILIYPFEKTSEILRFYREYTTTVSEELTSGIALLTAPPFPFIPEHLHGKPLLTIIGFYSGPLGAGERALQPLREFGPPLIDLIQPMPYSAAQTLIDPLYPRGVQNYWKTVFLTDVSDGAIDTLIDYFVRVPSPGSIVIIDHWGNSAVQKVDVNETAFPHRKWNYNFLITSLWTDPVDTEKNIRWTRELWDAMQPFAANGAYVNFMQNEGEDQVKKAYGAHYERLVALKNKYDPTNFFRLNQNIKPTIKSGGLSPEAVQ